VARAGRADDGAGTYARLHEPEPGGRGSRPRGHQPASRPGLHPGYG